MSSEVLCLPGRATRRSPLLGARGTYKQSYKKQRSPKGLGETNNSSGAINNLLTEPRRSLGAGRSQNCGDALGGCSRRPRQASPDPLNAWFYWLLSLRLGITAMAHSACSFSVPK